ncbi:hypothetical protein KQX54_005970 [Cotesia glomerata]|uniref:Uncharacterized protein n=1 Tax=Cotesia glomerata TaxID=32391 RepID=A0AAV7J327_COTGL|nr:hypothetical protein KQX54_005970 [Cotesia glomerata]
MCEDTHGKNEPSTGSRHPFVPASSFFSFLVISLFHFTFGLSVQTLSSTPGSLMLAQENSVSKELCVLSSRTLQEVTREQGLHCGLLPSVSGQRRTWIIGHTAKKCPQIIQSDIHREVVYSEKVTPLLDKIRESDFDTGYESFTSESGDLIGNLEMQIEQVIDRFTEAAAETQNTSLQEKDSVIEVPKTSIQENHVVDAPKTRRGRPRRHRVKFKERRLSPHEVTPLLDPGTDSEPDSAVGEDTSSESVDSINDLLQHKDNTIQFPKDNTVQVLNSNRQPDDEGLRIQKLSDTRLNSRFTDTRQVYWTQKTNTNNFDLEIHEWEARSKLKKPTVKLKGLFKRVLAPTAMAA